MREYALAGSETGQSPHAATLPGYRRVLRVEPAPGSVTALLEDDLHCMAVRLQHDGCTVSRVEPVMQRVPWTTCPGAVPALVRTFEGVALAEVTAKRDKPLNCTHLHDLAVIAARHAGDGDAIEYRIAVSDPEEVDGAQERLLEIGRNASLVHRWVERDGVLVSPPGLAGHTALSLRDWIAALPEPEREAARLLQWGSLVAHGRQMDDARRQASLAYRPSCFTMQPERVGDARMAGGIHDFSRGGRQPLENLGTALTPACP